MASTIKSKGNHIKFLTLLFLSIVFYEIYYYFNLLNIIIFLFFFNNSKCIEKSLIHVDRIAKGRLHVRVILHHSVKRSLTIFMLSLSPLLYLKFSLRTLKNYKVSIYSVTREMVQLFRFPLFNEHLVYHWAQHN